MARLLPLAFLIAVLMTPPVVGQEPDVAPTFSTESELVVLHVAVKDRKGGYVGGLGQDAFRVLEDRRLQEISFFNSQDAPVTVGLLIDSSGSMAPNRDLVIAASMAFTRAMNPQDEFFALHDAAIRGVRRALPTARVGGPDNAGAGDRSDRYPRRRARRAARSSPRPR